MFSTYKNKEDLWRLNKEPYDKEIIFLEEENAYYIWANNDWQPYDDFAQNLKVLDSGITFYDMNKQIISQIPSLTENDLASKAKVVEEFITERNNTFYMLYGKEISYFTVFQKAETETTRFYDVLLECLTNIGASIYSIERTEDKFAIEIWIEAEAIGPTVLYLFEYDSGIVPFGG